MTVSMRSEKVRKIRSDGRDTSRSKSARRRSIDRRQERRKHQEESGHSRC